MDIKRISKEDAWQLRHKVMWPEKDIEYVKLDDDDYGVHIGLVEGEQLISVVSLFIKSEEAQFRKFATLETYQNRGYGTRLLNFMLEEAIQAGVKRIYCNARSHKAPFYEKFGFQGTEMTFSKDGKDYIVMERYI